MWVIFSAAHIVVLPPHFICKQTNLLSTGTISSLLKSVIWYRHKTLLIKLSFENKIGFDAHYTEYTFGIKIYKLFYTVVQHVVGNLGRNWPINHPLTLKQVFFVRVSLCDFCQSILNTNCMGETQNHELKQTTKQLNWFKVGKMQNILLQKREITTFTVTIIVSPSSNQQIIRA